MRVLLGRRYEVLLAGSGDELRRRLESDGERIRVVLMDLSLKGGEDGLQLTRALRAQDRWNDLLAEYMLQGQPRPVLNKP